MGEVLMGFGHEPIWGVRGSPTDINYSMSKTFTPIPKWIDLDIEMIILVAWPHWHLAPTHISFMLSTRVNTEQARREATPFSFSLNYNVSFCRRNQSNPLRKVSENPSHGQIIADLGGTGTPPLTE